MHRPEAHPSREFVSRAALVSLILVLSAAGCSRSSPDALAIVTNWSEADCDRLVGELAPVRATFVRVPRDEDPTRALGRRIAVDAILGGPASSYERLRLEGRLRQTDGRTWLEIGEDRPGPASGLIAAEDRPAEWAAAYAKLVREFPLDVRPIAPTGSEGAALVAGSPRAEGGRALWKVLEERSTARPTPRPDVLFLNDLLAAALVDSDEELRAARLAIERADNPTRAIALLTEAPPWPPASVSQMGASTDGDALLAILAGQIAPEPSAREWLLASWDRPSRPIDGTTLDTLARAADGRLAAEPRFRAWLRSEWTAWTRQRYRRVVRRLYDSGKVDS